MREMEETDVLLGAAALFSGAALMIAIFFRRPLPATILGCAALATVAFAYRWSRTPPEARVVVKQRAAVGVVAGTLATLAYDVTRYAIVTFAHLKYQPFDTLFLFGYSLAGAGSSRDAALAAGIAYHWMNGVLFALAYCIVLGGRNWMFAIVWALALEIMMFTMYPTWLDLQAVKLEFTIVSLSGHLVYGVTLGKIAQHKLGARRTPDNGAPRAL